MDPGPSDTIEIKGSKGKLVLLLLGGILMTAGSLWVLTLTQGPGAAAGSVKAMIAGYVGAPFFGLCTLVALYRLLTSGRTLVTITPTAITDTRLAAREIPWTAVEDIGTWVYRGQKVIVLQVSEAIENGLDLTRLARMTRRANAALGADGLCITAQGLNINFQTLYEMIVGHLERMHTHPQGTHAA